MAEIRPNRAVLAADGRLAVRLRRLLVTDWEYLLIVAPVVAFYVVFAYVPMWGAIIAFKDFGFGDTIGSAPWVGLR